MSSKEKNERDLESLDKLPRAPEYFDDLSKAYYKKLGRIILDTGQVKDLDIFRLQQFAMELSCYHEMSKAIQEKGYVNKHDQVSPYVSIRNKAFVNITALAREFGLSFSARDKMASRFKGQDPNQMSLLDDLLRGIPGADDEQDPPMMRAVK